MFPNWAKNILFLLVYMLSGLTLALIIEGLLSGSELIPLNTAIEQGVVLVRTPLLTTLMVWITNIGSPFVLASAAVFLAVLLGTKGDIYNAMLMMTALVIAVLAFTVLKNIFQVARPASDLLQASGWSFPSGHATVATAFFFVMAHSFWYRLRTFSDKVLMVAGSVVGTLLVSFSRLYLGAHWALDILGGIALGLWSVCFAVLLFNLFVSERRLEKHKLGL